MRQLLLHKKPVITRKTWSGEGFAVTGLDRGFILFFTWPPAYPGTRLTAESGHLARNGWPGQD